MLEIRKTAVSFNGKDLMELEKIVTDGDEREALRFLKKSIYDRIAHAQQGRQEFPSILSSWALL